MYKKHLRFPFSDFWTKKKKNHNLSKTQIEFSILFRITSQIITQLSRLRNRIKTELQIFFLFKQTILFILNGGMWISSHNELVIIFQIYFYRESNLRVSPKEMSTFKHKI